MNHYDIDTASDYPRTKLFKEYENKIEFNRTQFMSVEINVLDTDPQIAADIANYIYKLVDKVKRRVAKNRAQMGLQIVENEYRSLQGEIQTMEDKITELRFKGVHDYESQSAVFNEQYAIALAAGASQSRIKQLERRLDTLAKYGGKYVAIRDELQLLKEEEVKLKTKFDQAKVDVNQNLPATFKVDEARPAERKTYPKRSVLILAVGFAVFILVVFTLLVRGTFLELRAKA
jgi:predicted  nucleic acid-binding Zn-ribbon protein